MTKSDLYKHSYDNFILGFIIGFILAVIIIKISTAQAQETTMTASVPENEVSHCVQVLKNAGYIK